ncbi:MAG: type II toxin-antitoxin system mRNA interferase toxin, RelE/StbE family [Selenomonadaceae bacterium]|nr:type II toxin-antitoxin system mRNA interferase toxin, RelE/StbE family [Selenomonadaceae bacterium]
MKGDKKDFRECHIAPNWLLIYQVTDEKLILTLSRTGTHDELDLE